MASNRDPQKSYRTNRRGRRITTSATRSKRVKASTAPKPTSSSTRANRRGSGAKKVTSSSNRPSSGSAKVTGSKPSPKKSFTMGGDTGRRGGTNQPAKPGPKTTGRPKGSNVKLPSKKTLSRGAKLATVLNPRSDLPARLVAGAGLAAELYRSSRGTKSKAKSTPAPKPPGPSKKASEAAKRGAAAANANKGKLKVKPKKPTESTAKRFDKAFAAARKSGKKIFTFEGKKYNTKVK